MFPAISGGQSTADIGDPIPYSCMLDSSLSQYFSRTFGTSTAANTSTTSVWAKKCETVGATGKMLFQAGGVATNNGIWHQGGTSDIVAISNSVGSNLCQSTTVVRDPTGWDHYCVVNNAGTWTFYKNNVSIATGSGTCNINQAATAHYIGSGAGTSYFANMYLANFIFVDGQALTPSSFGRTSADTGQWVNKTYTGSFGNNGFKLEFADPTFATYGMGKDTSGNNNHWTPQGGISSANQYTDTPTNNSCVLNPLDENGVVGVSAGNTKFTTSGANCKINSTIPVPSTGIWYWEVTATTVTNFAVGLAQSPINKSNNLGYVAGECAYNQYNGSIYLNGSAIQTGLTAPSNNDVFGLVLNSVAKTLQFYRNDTAYGTAVDISSLTSWVPAFGTIIAGAAGTVNFGQRTFTYDSRRVSSGAKALNTANLPEGTAAAPATFTGNANADGTYIPMNGTPETLSINGNAVTWGTHADRTAGGVKLRTASASYNASGSNTISASTFLTPNRKSVQKYQTAKGNP